MTVCPGVGLLDHVVPLFLVFWGTSILFSIVAVPVYIPTNSVWRTHFKQREMERNGKESVTLITKTLEVPKEAKAASSQTENCYLSGLCVCVCVCVHTHTHIHMCSVTCDLTDCMLLTRPLSPWDSLDKNTGVGFNALLQEIFPTQGWNLSLLHLWYCRWILYCWATGARGQESAFDIELLEGGLLLLLPLLEQCWCHWVDR